MLMFAQRLKFKNDVKGNSRWGWFLVDDQHHRVGYVDEGYDGITALETAAKALNMALYPAAAGERTVTGEHGSIYEIDLDGLVRTVDGGGYSRLLGFNLLTAVPGRLDGEIATTGGVPIFGISEYAVSDATSDRYDEARLFSRGRTRADALKSLSHGNTVVVNGWCRSYRALNGTITYGRAWLEATCI